MWFPLWDESSIHPKPSFPINYLLANLITVVTRFPCLRKGMRRTPFQFLVLPRWLEHTHPALSRGEQKRGYV